MTVGYQQLITQSDMAALASLANDKLADYLTEHSMDEFSFTGDPWDSGVDPGWKTELQRLRAAAIGNAAPGEGILKVWQRFVSGPWQVSDWNVDHHGSVGVTPAGQSGGGFHSCSFYHEDTGSEETITLKSQGPVNSAPDSPGSPPWTSITVRLRIGGTRTVKFTGALAISFFVYDGASLTATGTSDFPGLETFSNTYTSGSFGSLVASVFDQDVDPGEYTFEFTVGGDDGMGNLNQFDNGHLVSATLDTQNPFITLDFTDREEVPALHDDKTVYRIKGTLDDDWLSDTDYPFGILMIDAFGNWTTFSTVSWVNWESTTNGVFVAHTLMISDLGSDAHDVMPWNIIAPGPNYRSPPHEEDEIPEPMPAWQASHNYASPVTILDSNGNWQENQDTGISGGSEPAWGTVIGDLTVDNQVTWRCAKLARFIPLAARARMYSIPRYPWVKDGDGDPDYPNWGLFEPVRDGVNETPGTMWIYAIKLNRYGLNNGDGIYLKQGSEISVDLGCIRDGSFVSFGTWNTGDLITPDKPGWPVFTNATALAYQADERVDVQAYVVRRTDSFGSGVTFPISAPHYKDVETLLNLMP